MFQKDMKIAYMLDFYGDLLDNHTFEIMKSYYNDDLSLAEIASGVGISRQGIRHLIKKGEDQLEFFDSKLDLVQKYEETEQISTELTNIVSSLSAKGNCTDEIESLEKIITILTKGN